MSNDRIYKVKKQSDVIKENDIKILNIIRDGRDVVLSDNNYTSPKRWISCMKQRRKLNRYIHYEIKYEDVVKYPNIIQSKIAKKFNLRIKHKFSEYPDFVPDSIFNQVINTIHKRKKHTADYKEKTSSYIKRPLTSASIGKGKKAYIKLCSDKKERLEFEKELKLAGYIK